MDKTSASSGDELRTMRIRLYGALSFMIVGLLFIIILYVFGAFTKSDVGKSLGFAIMAYIGIVVTYFFIISKYVAKNAGSSTAGTFQKIASTMLNK